MKSNIMSQLVCQVHISDQYAAMTAAAQMNDTKPTTAIQTKAQKVTKIRRTRQSRNPQLSVARRNERERNRVRQVNDGFARLRERLPVHYQLESAAGESGCDSPDLSPSQSQQPQQSSAGSVAEGGASSSSKAKKFSKVETLRAAIQHIRWLERLLEQPILTDDTDGASRLTLEDEPLSCASTSTESQHQQLQTPYSQASEQFVKLEHQTIIQPAPVEYQQQQQQPQHDHTQLWIQQHQPSFQQQQYHQQQQQQQQQQHHQHHQHWYPQAAFMQQQQLISPEQQPQQQQLSPVSTIDSQRQQQQAPVWYSPASAGLESSPSPQHQAQQLDYQNSHNFHQISLYSQ